MILMQVLNNSDYAGSFVHDDKHNVHMNQPFQKMMVYVIVF